MLLKSEFHSISGQSPRTVGYDYDAMGNRTSATIASPATAATLTRRLTWGQDLAGSPSLQGAGGVGGLLMVEEITSTTNEAYHFHYDGNGNVTEITDHLGASVATYRYDAFGNTLVATGTYAATNRYRFSTKPLDHEVTTAPLYYYGYRYMDPLTGRWPSRDPIGEEGGVNLYGFLGNDGIMFFDVLGLSAGDFYNPGESGGATWPPQALNRKKMKIGILGTNLNHLLRLGDQATGEDSNSYDGYEFIKSGGADRIYESTHVQQAHDDVIEWFDVTGDGKLSKDDCIPYDVRILGYSWGGWSAMELSHVLSGSSKIENKDALSISMGTIDPVNTLRDSAAGRRSAGLGRPGSHSRRTSANTRNQRRPDIIGRADRVVLHTNYYETNGLGDKGNYNALFAGISVPSADTDLDVTEHSPDHISIALDYGPGVAQAIFGD